MKLTLISIGQIAELFAVIYVYWRIFRFRPIEDETGLRVYKIFKFVAFIAICSFALYVTAYILAKASFNTNLPIYEDLYHGVVFVVYIILFGLAYMIIENLFDPEKQIDD